MVFFPLSNVQRYMVCIFMLFLLSFYYFHIYYFSTIRSLKYLFILKHYMYYLVSSFKPLWNIVNINSF